MKCLNIEPLCLNGSRNVMFTSFLFCSVYSFYEDAKQSIIQNSFLFHGRLVILFELLGQTIYCTVDETESTFVYFL